MTKVQASSGLISLVHYGNYCTMAGDRYTSSLEFEFQPPGRLPSKRRVP